MHFKHHSISLYWKLKMLALNCWDLAFKCLRLAFMKLTPGPKQPEQRSEYWTSQVFKLPKAVRLLNSPTLKWHQNTRLKNSSNQMRI